MFELAVLLSLAAVVATAWLIHRDRVAEGDDQRIKRKTKRLDALEKSVKRLSEELKDV